MATGRETNAEILRHLCGRTTYTKPSPIRGLAQTARPARRLGDVLNAGDTDLGRELWELIRKDFNHARGMQDALRQAADLDITNRLIIYKVAKRSGVVGAHVL